MTQQWLAVIAIPAIAAWIAIAMLARSRVAARLADVPNERSLHSAPTARVGGIGLMLAALPVAFWVGDTALRAVVACAAVLALVSAADDVRSLPIAIRLPAHAVAAAVAILAIADSTRAHGALNMVEAAVAILAIVWMTNLYNFMDGSDGLAGGMSAIGFGALALAAVSAREWPLAFACAAIASASAAFLAHNFPPARVFLGDAGSVPLGFLAGALGVHGALRGTWHVALPLIVFSPFIADASVTIARRLLRGEPFWRAHRSHYYQRVVLAGWTRRQLAARAYLLMIAAACCALAAQRAEPAMQFAIIAGWIALYAVLFIAIERRLKAAAS